MEDINYFSYKTEHINTLHSKRGNQASMILKHYHPWYEIYYLVDGQLDFFIHDRVYSMGKGDIVFLSPQIIHRTLPSKTATYEMMLLEFHEDFIHELTSSAMHNALLESFQTDYSIHHLSGEQRLLYESSFLRMIKTVAGKEHDSNLLFNCRFLEVVALLNEFSNNKIRKQQSHPSKTHEKIAEVVAYINENYHRDISLDEVSSEFFMSPEHLSRTFKKITNFTFIEYITDVRLRHAENLLTHTNKKVTDIASEIGYQSSSHFGRIFRSKMGTSPRRFRQSQKNIITH